ncbi:MAG: DNA polymerase III subunit gamma/tau [Pseudanabaenaceae cyanobacterium bins.68]|nr:DNA polymerase III subunit gamma/tau [Pseudanabaenaceae cyanobacterium bins.68]
MAHTPLHHKYRPQVFADLVGQEAIAQTLGNALRLGRIAPAYLFTGARGTGKTSSARIMAKSLNCLASDCPTPSPCGLCDLCRGVTTGNALDVTEIDAASNTGVDSIRELIERSQFAPVQARYKVYVIDEVHMLSTSAFNALLKTLEEPPPRVVFILATTDPQRVLPTIISRCQRFDFRRIPQGAIAAHLAKIASLEQIQISPAAVDLVAQIAQGGLRDAEALLDQLSLLEGEISPNAVWDLVGVVPERDLLAILEAIASGDGSAVLTQVRQVLDRGREPLMVLQNLAGCLRDLLIAQTSDRRDLVPVSDPSWQTLQELAQNFSPGAVLQAQQHLRQAEGQIKNSSQPRLWLEIALLGLMQGSDQTLPSSQPRIRVSAPAPSPVNLSHAPAPSSTPSPVNLATPPTTQAPSPDLRESLEDKWEKLLKVMSPVLRGLLKDCQLLAYDQHQVKIGFKNPTLKGIAEGKKAEIALHCEQLFGQKISVNFVVAAASSTVKSVNQPKPRSPEPPPPIVLAPTLAPRPEPSPPPLVAVSPTDSVQEFAVKNVAEFFKGQIIDLDQLENEEQNLE